MTQPGTGTSDSRPRGAQRSPFQGLGFYTESDARWFFGRTTERKIILAHLRTARLTLLYAESGVGKSSLLRAGVAARLRELAAPTTQSGHSARFVPVVFSDWRDNPVDGLISEMERQLGPLVPGTHAGNGSPTSFALPRAGLTSAIKVAAETLDATLVILLDQFEEHFSYRMRSSRPDLLADELAECVRAPDLPANFLIAVREDAYGRLGDLFSGRIGNVYHNYLHLEFLTRDEAREAIEKPIETYNADHPEEEPVRLEDDLADTVLDEVRRGNLEIGDRRAEVDAGATQTAAMSDEIETPFLQLVMSRLWEFELARGSRVLRHASLDGELGGAETIVRNHVRRALSGLAGGELDTATDMFHALVTPSGVKVAHTADDLAQMTAHPRDSVTAVLGTLYEQRILRAVDPAPGTTKARYELFHDRLAAPVLDWRDAQANARLQHARKRAEQEVVSQRAQARRFKRRARIMLALAASMFLLLVAVVVLWQYARDQTASAGRAKHAALHDTVKATYFGLLARAQSQLTSRPDVSLLLYLSAYVESPQRVAERSMVATFQGITRSGTTGLLHGHTDAIGDLAFSPVGGTLASVSADKTVRLWAVTTQGHHPLGSALRASAPLYSVAFDPRGAVVAAGGFNEVVLWSTKRHAELRTVPFDSGTVNAVAFSRVGNLLAAGGSDGRILLWNTTTHRRVILPPSSGASIKSVAFSPGGELLAAASASSVELWNVATASQVGQPLSGATGGVYAVSFSPDGRTVAGAGGRGTIVRWDVASRAQVLPALVWSDPIYSVAYSPDGRTIAAGTTDKTVLWNLDSHAIAAEPLRGHHGAVYGVAFSPVGHLVASGGADRTILLWKYPVGRRFGDLRVHHPAAVDGVALSPDGSILASGDHAGNIFLSDRRTGILRRRLFVPGDPVSNLSFDPSGRILASAYLDGAIRIWNVVSGTQIGGPLRGHRASVYSIAFDSTGHRLVSGGFDGTVRLWNVRTHAELGAPLTGNLGPVFAVAISPDDRVIAAGGEGRSIRLWNARSGAALPHPVIPQDNSVFALAFSPNHHLLASGGAGDTVHLWRVDSYPYTSSWVLSGDSNFIRSLAFSPDGGTLASGSSDANVRLWDVATGTELGTPITAHQRSVESLAFSRDGRFFASGSVDQTVRVWQGVDLPPSFDQVRNRICSFLDGGLSRSEWSLYAPEIPYRQTCPTTTPS